MDEPVLHVKFFRTEAGNEPVRKLLRELPLEDRKITGADIKEVQFGWPLGVPLVRKMEMIYGKFASTSNGGYFWHFSQ
jgi:hypothetical protein